MSKRRVPKSSGVDHAGKDGRRIPASKRRHEATGRRMAVPSAAARQPEDKLRRTLTFRFDCLDLENECHWSLANVSPTDQLDLLKHMRQYEAMTVGDLRSGNLSAFKSYPDFSSCPNKDAVDRLATLYGGYDSIARFRLSSKKRLYGFLVENEFHLLWWDPNHEVWPSKKRNT